LTAEQEAVWNGLFEEVKKIDLNALEGDLENLKQIYEEKQTRDLWETLADDALANETELDARAQRIVAEGNGRKFLFNMSKMAAPTSAVDKAARQVVDRIAARVALLMSEQTERKGEEPRPADAATRRAVAAQEVAANEAALAARLVAAREMRQLTEEVEQSKRNLAALQEAERLAKEAENQQEADRTAALALRGQYRMSRVWAIVFFPVVMVCVGTAGVGLMAWRPMDWVWTLGGVLFLGSPFVALVSSSLTWGKGNKAGRKFNEVGPLFGLPVVAVKSKSQQDAAGGCTSEMAGGCGCIGIVVIAVGLWGLGTYHLNKGNTPAPANTPPATNSEPLPPSNAVAPSNSPAGNTAPPANGESAPASNAPK